MTDHRTARNLLALLDGPHDPARHHRVKAEEARTLAEACHDPGARASLLSAARAYDLAAQSIERMMK